MVYAVTGDGGLGTQMFITHHDHSRGVSHDAAHK